MILVIGYGNPLCGDDGIGPYVVEKLIDAQTQPRAAMEYLTLRQLTPELAETISRADTVIFVDAADDEEIPGSITCRELTPSAAPSSGAFTHHTHAAALLESARFLYDGQPAAYLYTIVGENFGLGDAFSSAVETALPSLLTQLKARIDLCTNLASLKQ